MIKLVATDLDGTLLGKDNRVSKRNKQAIDKLISNGANVVFTSGREFGELDNVFESLGYKVDSICLNGGDYRDKDGNSLFVYPLDKSVVEHALRYSKEKNYLVSFHGSEGTYMTTGLGKYIDEFSKYVSYSNKENNDASEFLNYFAGKCRFNLKDEDIVNMSIIKIEYVYLFKDQQNEVIEEYKRMNTYPTSAFYGNVEINPINVSKGNMLKRYCDDRGINYDDVYVFGDGLNDMSMFEQFENSVAMGNSEEQIKEKAKYITLDNVDDGFGVFIENTLEK